MGRYARAFITCGSTRTTAPCGCSAMFSARGGAGHAGLRGAGRGLLCRRRVHAVAPLHHHPDRRPPDQRNPPDRHRKAGRGAGAGRRARAGARIQHRALGRPAPDPHQRRRRGRLQDHDRAHRRAGPRELARDDPAQGRPADPRHDRLQGFLRAAGARGRAAAHRDPRARRQANTRSPSTRTPMRSGCRAASSTTQPPALHLFLDDDAVADLRL